MLERLKRLVRRMQAPECYNCEFSQTFRSNGDGQVSRLHTFCRNPRSPYHDRPIPPERLCDAWQKAKKPKGPPEEIEEATGLTA